MVRKVVFAHLRTKACVDLAARRNETFGGLEGINDRAHRRLLKTCDHWEQTLLMKLWTGSILTRAKAAKLGEHDPSCGCGCLEQTLYHVLWECPEVEPPHEDLVHCKSLPTSQSVAHILPKGATNSEERIWRSSCKRAIAIIKMLPTKPKTAAQDNRVPRLETRGHEVSVMGEASYAFCTKCFISRRIRDMKWIWAKPCLQEAATPSYIGSCSERMGHDAVLEAATWKGSALRPRWKCKKCLASVWATATFKDFCPGAEA